MISWLCGRTSAGKSRACRAGSSAQCEPICGVSELVNQVSKTSASPTKPPGLAALRPCSRAATSMVRVDRQCSPAPRWAGRTRAAPSAIERVPDRELHAEVALPADAPVLVQALGPALVARAHERRVPPTSAPFASSASFLSSRRTNHWRVVMNSSGRSPFSKNLTMRSIGRGSPWSGAPWPCARVRGLAEQRHDRGARLLDGLAGELGVARLRLRVEAREVAVAEAHRREPAGAIEDLPERELLLAPPDHVGRVAEGADHRGCPCPCRARRGGWRRWAPRRGTAA